MRNFLLLAVIMVVLAGTASAESLFRPKNFYLYSSHKANITVDVRSTLNVEFESSLAFTYNFGSGARYPIAANAVKRIGIHPDRSQLVFYVTSTALTNKTKVYIAEETR